MIDPKEMLATLVDRFAVTAKVQNVFGEPIEAHGKTIIPVARVSYRLGAGGGRERKGQIPLKPRAASVAALAALAAWFKLFLPGWLKLRKWEPASYVSSTPKWLLGWSQAGSCSACCYGDSLADGNPARDAQPIHFELSS